MKIMVQKMGVKLGRKKLIEIGIFDYYFSDFIIGEY